MELSVMMDNDSGYVSHHQESNLDSSSENPFKTRSCSTHDLFLSEDALLEKPLLKNSSNFKRNDSFDSVVNSSQESVKTEFSGFEDSDVSDASFVVPRVEQIVWNSGDWKENSPDSLNTSANTSKNSSFTATSPKKPFTGKVLANVTNTYDQNSTQAVFKNLTTDKENIRPIVTPKKQYENRLTSDVSPDLFSEEEEISIRQKSSMKKGKESPTENYCTKDMKLLRRVQSCLSGVHPPPSVTIVQISVAEMLERIEENKSLFWKCSTVTREDRESKSLLINDKPECVGLNWPKILKSRYHGLHHNRNKTSEDFEHLCLKYAERYIGAETQSSCTIFDSNPSSSHKRKSSKPRWGAKSPGRRLSHLARRRITFSSTNLQAGSGFSAVGSRARQILVDCRKMSMLKKSPKKSPKKTPSKSPFKMRKNTPSSSAKKKLALRFREMSGEFENVVPGGSCGLSFKRALFSNDKDSGSFGGSIEKKSTKRALFSSPLKPSPQKKSPFKLHTMDKKRKRSDLDESNPCKLPRSMSLDMQAKKPDTKLLLNRTLSDLSTSRPEELSDQHKKKLQWAVYESLRLQNINPTHPQYKIFASVLARVTRKFLPNLRFEGRTTEKMFRIARHHSYAVVKGKSVDEIVNEYVKNRAKSQKPQGYIGIAEFQRNERNDKENVLQDKANIIESIEKRREHAGSKSRFFGQNRIDRIKKVISFEDKDN